MQHTNTILCHLYDPKICVPFFRRSFFYSLVFFSCVFRCAFFCNLRRLKWPFLSRILLLLFWQGTIDTISDFILNIFIHLIEVYSAFVTFTLFINIIVIFFLFSSCSFTFFVCAHTIVICVCVCIYGSNIAMLYVSNENWFVSAVFM